MTPTSKVAGTALAVLFLLLFFAALGARLWASNQSTHFAGPTHLAVGNDRVYAHVDGQLHVLSTDGVSLDRVAVEQLGLDDAPIDLRVLSDGRLLVAGQQPARLRLCDPARWQCVSIGTLAGKLRAQLKAAVDEPRSRLLIVGFDSTRIYVEPLTAEAGEAKTLDAGGILDNPNDIAVDPNGRIWVADSGHHRVVALEADEQAVREVGVSFTARNALARPGRDWPMMLALASDGNWWVTQPNAFGKGTADLLVYHPVNGAQTRIPLPDDADPTDIARLGEAMLVTDAARFAIYRIDAQTHSITPFGDASFRNTMQEAAAQRARLEGIMTHALTGMIAFGALMIAAAVWATPRGKRFTPPPAPPLAASDVRAPILHQTHWLKRDPKADRLLRWLTPMTYLLTVVILASLAGLSFLIEGGLANESASKRLETVEELKNLFILSIFVFGGLPLLMGFGVRNLRARLGTDGQRLFVKLDEGRQASFSPERLVYSGRHIAAGDRLFMVQLGNGRPLYAKGEVETFITPLLRRAKKLSAFGMFRYLVTHRESSTMAALVYAVAATSAIVATGAWRHLLD